MSERWDAGAAVAGGAPPVEVGDHLESLRDEAGWVVGAVDTVVRTLTGHDLVAELVEPLAGDFATLGSMQQGWRQVQTALVAVGENHADLAGQLPGAWDGGARLSAGDALDRLAETASLQAEASGMVAEQLGHVLSVSTAVAEAVCACLRLIDDVVVSLAIKAAAGPVGWVLSAATAPLEAARIAAYVQRAQAAIRRLVRAVETCLQVVVTVKAAIDATAVLAEAVAVGSHARAAHRVDDVVDTGFGR